MDDDCKPVDHPSRETVAVRQGMGSRATVSVLVISVILAVVAGIGLAACIMLTGSASSARVLICPCHCAGLSGASKPRRPLSALRVAKNGVPNDRHCSSLILLPWLLAIGATNSPHP